MRPKGVHEGSTSYRHTKRPRRWSSAAWLVAVSVAIAAFSSQASASTRLEGSIATKSKPTVERADHPAGHAREGQKRFTGLFKFLNGASSLRRFAAEKVVIGHSTSSDTN